MQKAINKLIEYKNSKTVFEKYHVSGQLSGTNCETSRPRVLAILIEFLFLPSVSTAARMIIGLGPCTYNLAT